MRLQKCLEALAQRAGAVPVNDAHLLSRRQVGREAIALDALDRHDVLRAALVPKPEALFLHQPDMHLHASGPQNSRDVNGRLQCH